MTRCNRTACRQHGRSAVQVSVNDYVLIVGGLGYIGSHTAWMLLKAGQHNIIIVDNLANSTIHVLQSLYTLRDKMYENSPRTPRISFHDADYCDQDRMRDILSYYQNFLVQDSRSKAVRARIVGVFHFAAFKAVTESFRKPLDYYANNVGGLISFCKTLKEFDIKTLIFSSSANVYGAGNGADKFTESQSNSESCHELTNPYGRTKWMSEAILGDLAASDRSWTIIALRYFNPVGCDSAGLLGEEPSGPPSNLMPLIIKAMTTETNKVHIYGTDWDTPDGTAIRDYIHVSDLAEGHSRALRVIQRQEIGPGFHTFNLGTGKGHSVKEILATMEGVSGIPIKVSETGRREGDSCACVADVSRARNVLGWKAHRSVAEACRDICHRLSILSLR